MMKTLISYFVMVLCVFVSAFAVMNALQRFFSAVL